MADSMLALKATWFATNVAARVSPRLAGPVAARLWFTPWRIPVSDRAAARQAEWLGGTEPVSFDVEGRRIAGYATGSGPAVLLVHGWGERGASLGAFVAPLAGAGYRVVGIDLPAHGATAGGQTDGFEIADAIRGVCESIGEVSAVIAHSMGGMTSLLAARDGAPVDALVLIAPPGRLDNALATFQSMFELPDAAVSGLKATIEHRYGADVWDRLSAQAFAADVDVPALIVHDRDDQQVAFGDTEALHASWPGSRLMTTEGLGHGRILRDPEVVQAALSFVTEVAPARRPANAEA
jgi:pimeloyl-ACP methyl ester carboxylesterase